MKLGNLIRQQRRSLSLTQDQVAARAGISKPYLSNIETGKANNPPTDGVLEKLERALSFEPGALRQLAHLERTPADVIAAKEATEAELEKLKGILKELLVLNSGGEAGGLGLDDRLRDIDLDGGPAPGGGAMGRPFSAGRAIPLINKVAAGYPHNFTDLDYPPRVAEDYVRCPEVADPNAFAACVCGDSMQPRYCEGDIVVFAPNAQARNGDDCFVRFADSFDTTFKRFYADPDGLIRLQPLNPDYPAKRYRPEEIDGIYPAVFRMEKLR